MMKGLVIGILVALTVYVGIVWSLFWKDVFRDLDARAKDDRDLDD